MSEKVIENKRWKRPPMIKRTWLRVLVWVGIPLYVFLSFGSMEVNWNRVIEGIPRGQEFILSFSSPDFVTRWDDISAGIYESLVMAFASTVVGILISIPIGLGAAKNLSPAPIYFFCRGIISISRALQEIIVAILMVAIFGFGPFAGFITLAFSTIGFLAKLLAERIEDVSKSQSEAIRATGASWPQWILYGIHPQVLPRLIGLSMYRLDINFRESAILGIVGAGGIGATLNTAFDRYEFDTAAAILLIIIGLVLIAEYTSSWLRVRVQ
ncbi:phosphonate ABC transporter, permease protein PhnE [Curvivirga sp.]|uniref:phosphonate ABC transporter, permease protein PhnE n=1 Tax=Curvivirga sp. TaxID=2856848 RepID=UPI003B58F7C1